MKHDESRADSTPYLTKAQGRSLLNVSDRTFDGLVARGIVPQPLMLGPRSLRWKRSELIAAIDAMPRGRGAAVKSSTAETAEA